MFEPDPEKTQPNEVQPITQPIKAVTPVKGKFPRWLVAAVVIVLVAIGILSGYSSGMGQRFAAQKTQVSGQLSEQFQLGMQAYDAGSYELARQYFEFIIRSDPNFPGVQAAYTDLLLKMQASPTPVFSPTPEISPTPDLRGAEEIFNTAQQLLNAGDWTGAITNLDSVRKSNPEYRTAEVDGMYFMALRQRGVNKIISSCQEVNLEGGIYDLTLAEHFVGEGNLDAYSQSLRTYARFYIIGASFWDQDWVQSQNFFEQVMDAYPNMSDSSCLSARRRWIEATTHIAETYLAAGDPCGAEEIYNEIFTMGDSYLATLAPTATEIAIQCDGGPRAEEEEATPEGPPPVTPTP